MEYVKYLKSLIAFIKKNLTKTLINQDLNPLVKQRDLDKLIPHISDDIISFLEDEISRMN